MDRFEATSWKRYNSPDLSVRRSLDYLQMLGYTDGDAAYRVERNHFSSLLVGRVYEGEGRVRVGGRTRTLGPGCLFLLDCRRPHRYWTEQAPWRFRWVHLFGPHLPSFMDLQLPQGIALHGGVRAARMTEELDALFTLMREEQPSRRRDLAQNAHILILLGEAAVRSEGAGYVPPAVLSALEWMQDHLSEPFSLAQLARDVSLSRSHLLRLFKKHVGETPGRYHSKVRIDRSKALLENTGLSVEAIAERVGFSDASAYIRCFRGREGVTPARFRSQAFGVGDGTGHVTGYRRGEHQ